MITLLRAEPDEDHRVANLRFFYDEWAYRRRRNGRSTGSMADVLRILEYRIYSATPSKFRAKLDMQDETIDLAGLRRLKERAIADQGTGAPVAADTEGTVAARRTHEPESAPSLKTVDTAAKSVGSDAQAPSGDADLRPRLTPIRTRQSNSDGGNSSCPGGLGAAVVIGIAGIVVAVLASVVIR